MSFLLSQSWKQMRGSKRFQRLTRMSKLTSALCVLRGENLRFLCSSVFQRFWVLLHFHPLYSFLNSALSNLPVDVCGNSFTNTKSSGSCHLANFAPRNSRSSSAVADSPSLNTTTASGRSCHFE